MENKDMENKDMENKSIKKNGTRKHDMKSKDIKIVVTGDICLSLLQWITNNKSTNSFTYQQHPSVHYDIKPGGALLLAKLVKMAIGVEIIAPKIQDIQVEYEKEILQSSILLDLFPATKLKRDIQRVYRIQKFLGFSEPDLGLTRLLPIKEDNENADLVVLYDEDNGFNLNQKFWPQAVKSKTLNPVIIYKMYNPSDSALLRHIEEYHNGHTIVVITGDDLRAKGVNISKSLSWERTALDFVWQINNNPEIAFLAKCHHLIVPFGLEGAIYYNNEKEPKSSLYFLTNEFEDDFANECLGMMYGLTSCFIAGLARKVYEGIKNQEELSKSIAEGIREGIVATQKYFIYGFGKNVEEKEFPNPAIFIEEEGSFIFKEHVQDVTIRNTNNPNCQACWYILKDKSSTNLAEIAYDIVKNGEKDALKFIPIAKFGNLKTVDRTEIEGYRSIKNLFNEYISTTNTVRPLSIAIFGTPGSGKSFGVTEIAANIAPNLIEKLDFNLSQFRSVQDLISAFHRVRDVSLKGKIPLVFFDEFDSAFDGKLGWLKYFLSPMQDGVFREGDSIHPIGKAIFAFAGGTSNTYKKFCGEEIREDWEIKRFTMEFQLAKGPDFVSRLRGYVNILGPNQTDEKWDQLFIIRRAMLLRSLLERKTPHLINNYQEAQVDNGIIRALLKVPRYKHESRSMEAILEMSRLTNAKKWEQSDLPSKDQLSLHVDEEQFLRNLMQDAFYSERIEKIARGIYKSNKIYLNLYEGMNELTKQNMSSKEEIDLELNADRLQSEEDVKWEELTEEKKYFYRDQAKHIPNALHKINYDTISVNEKPELVEFTDKELQILAAYEHKRWCLQMKEDGWKHGGVGLYEEKRNPYLLPWNELPDNRKKEVIQLVKSWPEILVKTNFKIERLKFLCYCETQLKFYK